MLEPFGRVDQRRWGAVYLHGLLLEGHFVTSSPWDPAQVRARLTWRIQPVVRPTALIVNDTGFLKDGDASACVTRQYSGTAGACN